MAGFFGWLGTFVVAVVGSTAFFEWLNKRGVRAAISTDLEVWKSLPDGEAKDQLLRRIEAHAGKLARDRNRWGYRRWRNALLLLVPLLYVVGYIGVLAIEGGLNFHRDNSGVLRLYYSDGSSYAFKTVCSG